MSLLVGHMLGRGFVRPGFSGVTRGQSNAVYGTEPLLHSLYKHGIHFGQIRTRSASFASECYIGGMMRSKQVAENPKTFVIILDTGDEILSSLKNFAKAEHLAGSSFKAIGALSSVELGWFDWASKKYQTAVKLDEQVELLSLIGDIALKEDEPQIHAHLVIGRRDGTAHGGHLMSAIVRPTCEIVVTENPQHLQKEIDAESGLALIRL